jgi:DNA modification methylase
LFSPTAAHHRATNVWRIAPSCSPIHPTTFPVELAERVVRYYPFRGDLVLDPFGGIGTVGTAALTLDRRFFLIERRRKYVEHFLETERRRFPRSGRRPAPANRSSAR